MKLSINRFLAGNARSIKAKKNVLASTIIRGADAIIYIFIVPLTLGYLNPYEYGVWLTLNSILVWINSFDIGLGNGLRNKLSVALAENNIEKARLYVSTTFFVLISIISFVYLIGLFFIYQIDWYSLLNVREGTIDNLPDIVSVSFLFFCANFVLKTTGNVYQALQLPALNNLITFLGNFISLVVIFILTIISETGSLFWVAFAYSAAPTVVYLIAYPITFKKYYRYLEPSIRFCSKNSLKDLMSLSVVFFVLQIAGVVLFGLSNVLISKLFGPDQVTPYNIAYRYFSFIPMLFVIIITPVWSAVTEAYVNKDFSWIGRCNKAIQKMLLISGFVALLMVLLSDMVYKVWVGDKVVIPIELSAVMAIYIFIYIWSLSFSYFLNGLGRLRIQMYCTLLAALCFYPVCSYLGERYGLLGVTMGMCIINLPGAVLNTIQFNKVMNNTDRGIWGK